MAGSNHHRSSLRFDMGVFRCGCRGWPYGPTVDLEVDPICQAVLVLHLQGDVSEDLAQEPPDHVCDVADTGVAYATDQPLGVDGYGVHHPTVDFKIQYAGRGFVLADLYSDHPGILGVQMPDSAVAFLGSACDRAEAVHQVGAGVGEYSYPGMTIYPVSHIRYNTISGVIPEKMSSSSDQCGR